MQGTGTNNCEISLPPCIRSLFNVFFPDNESWPKKPFLSPNLENGLCIFRCQDWLINKKDLGWKENPSAVIRWCVL